MLSNADKKILVDYFDNLLNTPCYGLIDMEAIQVASEINQILHRMKLIITNSSTK